MLTVLLAAAGWVVVGWVPGFLLVEMLRPAGGRLRNAALAPMVALGVNMIASMSFTSDTYLETLDDMQLFATEVLPCV